MAQKEEDQMKHGISVFAGCGNRLFGFVRSLCRQCPRGGDEGFNEWERLESQGGRNFTQSELAIFEPKHAQDLMGRRMR
jgi:hypothetical protein